MPKQDGRVVINMDPQLKRRLKAALAMRGLTMKDWFVRRATLWLQQINDPPKR